MKPMMSSLECFVLLVSDFVAAAAGGNLLTCKLVASPPKWDRRLLSTSITISDYPQYPLRRTPCRSLWQTLCQTPWRTPWQASCLPHGWAPWWTPVEPTTLLNKFPAPSVHLANNSDHHPTEFTPSWPLAKHKAIPNIEGLYRVDFFNSI